MDINAYPIQAHISRGPKWHGLRWSGWFRMFGYGFMLQCRTQDYRPLFSERYGYWRVVKLGPLAVRWMGK